ncbi:SpoIIE family protein phosphatase [Magnetofaba australis]|uniref:Putative response regulator receiver protein n=1 Tax=Magnetofaba australis IT-1 TaxID=1434232 RepID=A0A1Y2K6I1_9PROT|nr:SpoIIE family protein phosphatase [Magnetofaba australis]OSM05274.1 putative response regulator receiver protein [Magnetofaba australis IT-1]
MDQERILLVDDDPDQVLLVRRYLLAMGYDVVVAYDGKEAIAKFQQHPPSLAILDVVMPGMNGLEVTRAIKSMTADPLLPVIFLTALEEESDLARCLAYGGDDFILKPVNKLILQARIDAWIRKRRLALQLKSHRDQLAQERQFIEESLSRIRNAPDLDTPDLRYVMTPVEASSGDVLLAATRPDGGRHIFLGDFTGHGLPAALGAPLVSDIFTGMSERGFRMDAILLELNNKLNQRMPPGAFLAAAALEMNPYKQAVQIWNAGLPDVLIMEAGRIIRRVDSRIPPLGILTGDQFQAPTVRSRTSPMQRIVMSTDGAIEAQNANGDYFGADAYEALLLKIQHEELPFDHIHTAVRQFCGATPPQDDVTAVELNCQNLHEPFAESRIIVESAAQFRAHRARQSACGHSEDPTWRLDATLEPDALRGSDWVIQLTRMALHRPTLRRHAQKIFIILRETFSNALDYGLLRLDPSLKYDLARSTQYSKLRQERLRELTEGEIRINIAYFANTGECSGHPCSEQDCSGEFRLDIRDSGAGFDYVAARQQSQGGLRALARLCDEVNYHDQGNRLTITFRLRED